MKGTAHAVPATSTDRVHTRRLVPAARWILGARLEPFAEFFTAGAAEKLVYCPSSSVEAARTRFGAVATVVDGGAQVGMAGVSGDPHARGVRRLMVEGGAQVHTQFLAGGLADELQLVVAPFFVGDSRAPRIAGDGAFPWRSGRPARLAEVRAIGLDPGRVRCRAPFARCRAPCVDGQPAKGRPWPAGCKYP